MARQRPYGWRLLQAMLAAVLGVEGDSVLGPVDVGIVEFEPRHAEDDREVADGCGIELDGLGMVVDLKLDGGSLLVDDAGRGGTSVEKGEVLRWDFGTQRDGVGLRERGVDEVQRCATVDQREGRDRDIVERDGDGGNDVLLGVEAGDRERVSNGCRQDGTLRRARRMVAAQRSALYCCWAGSFFCGTGGATVAIEARPYRGGCFGRRGQYSRPWSALPQYMHRLSLRRRSFSSSESRWVLGWYVLRSGGRALGALLAAGAGARGGGDTGGAA